MLNEVQVYAWGKEYSSLKIGLVDNLSILLEKGNLIEYIDKETKEIKYRGLNNFPYRVEVENGAIQMISFSDNFEQVDSRLEETENGFCGWKDQVDSLFKK